MREILDTSQSVKKAIGQDIYDFLKCLVSELINQLPLSNPVFNSLDSVHLRDDLLVFEKKIKIIGNHLGITILALFLICIGILNEQNVSLFQDEFNKLSTYGSQYFTRFAQSNLHLWDLIEKEGFCLLPQIARAAQSLSTISSDVEQAFSIAKLIKTEKRSRLKEQTLESILIIWSFFRDKADIKSTQLQTGKLNEGQNQVTTLTEFNELNRTAKQIYGIKITDNMLVLFDNVVTSLNERKSRERSAQKHDQKRKADVFDLLNQSSIEMKEELKRFKLNGINEYQDVDATPVHLNFNHKTP